jgi:hypothetical protein
VRVVKELKSQKPDFIVLTGDGEWEYRILSALGKKYSCSKILWYPKAPMKSNIRLQKHATSVTGVSVYNAIQYYASKGLSKFLVLYDREHFKGIDYDLKYLEQRIKINVADVIQLLEDTAFLINGKLGSRVIDIALSIQGISEKGNINEEIIELIWLKHGQRVEPEHGLIKSFLKRSGIGSIDDLVSSSGKKYLEQAFRGLCAVLKKIEELY